MKKEFKKIAYSLVKKEKQNSCSSMLKKLRSFHSTEKNSKGLGKKKIPLFIFLKTIFLAPLINFFLTHLFDIHIHHSYHHLFNESFLYIFKKTETISTSRCNTLSIKLDETKSITKTIRSLQLSTKLFTRNFSVYNECLIYVFNIF